MYLQTRLINSIHLHIKFLSLTIPPYLTTTVNVAKNIKNLIHRAFNISSKTIYYKELTNIKQNLGNNNFLNKLVD